VGKTLGSSNDSVVSKTASQPSTIANMPSIEPLLRNFRINHHTDVPLDINDEPKILITPKFEVVLL
jgi:hypothetical protein